MTPSPSRSAMLVAACRALMAEEPENRRLFDDPYATLFADGAAMVAAREQPGLATVIWLRTRYIDDAVRRFIAGNGPTAQVLILGCGADARAFRLGLGAAFFEVDFASSIDAKTRILDAAAVPDPPRRHVAAVDLAKERFVEPVVAAGFDPTVPTIVVWEGVTFYLTDAEGVAVVGQLLEILRAGDELVLDYASHHAHQKGKDATTAPTIDVISRDGEEFRTGFVDLRGTLDGHGFDVVDDEVTEHLASRYGWAPLARRFPSRMLTARVR